MTSSERSERLMKEEDNSTGDGNRQRQVLITLLCLEEMRGKEKDTLTTEKNNLLRRLKNENERYIVKIKMSLLSVSEICR